MIELDTAVLTRFRAIDGVALSVYLNLSSDDPIQQFRQAIAQAQQTLPLSEEQQRALQENIDAVEVYILAQADRLKPGVAIFCSSWPLFWQVYHLKTPPPTQVFIGEKFETTPLKDTSFNFPISLHSLEMVQQ